MSHGSATDQPLDLAYFSLKLLESMYQLLPLTVLKISQSPRKPWLWGWMPQVGIRFSHRCNLLSKMEVEVTDFTVCSCVWIWLKQEWLWVSYTMSLSFTFVIYEIGIGLSELEIMHAVMHLALNKLSIRDCCYYCSYYYLSPQSFPWPSLIGIDCRQGQYSLWKWFALDRWKLSA